MPDAVSTLALHEPFDGDAHREWVKNMFLVPADCSKERSGAMATENWVPQTKEGNRKGLSVFRALQ